MAFVNRAVRATVPGTAPLLAGCCAALLALPALAQDTGEFSESVPAEPAWNAPVEPGLPQDEPSTPAPSAPTTAADPQTGNSAQERGRALTPSVADSRGPRSRETVQAISDLAPIPGGATAPREEIGVPSDDGWQLPILNDPYSPFFEMEGLRVRIGDAQVRFTLGLSFVYDDNIFDTKTPKVGDYITTITPTIAAGIGDFAGRKLNYFALIYSPQPQLFAENTNQNTINERLEIASKYNFRRLTTEAGFLYRKDSNPDEDDIGRQERRFYTFSLENSYAVGARTALELNFEADYQDYVNRVDYTDLSVNVNIAYAYSAKLRLSLGPAAGITLISDGGERTYQSIVFGFQYDSFAKLTFRGNVAVRSTQFEGDDSSGASDFLTPTFRLGAIYNLSDRTNFTLDLNRVTRNSGQRNGQLYITTSAFLGYTQIFLRNWSFALQLGYSIQEYQGNNANQYSTTYLVGSPSLGYTFWRERCTWSIFYSRAERLSDQEAYQFNSNVIGTRVVFQF